MYTSYIGRRLLMLYRERTGEDLTARQFFEQQLYPLFYAHKRYLQWVPNSPFAQKVAQGNLVAGKTESDIQLATFHHKVASVVPDASFVIGFPAAGVEGTTSGQVSNIGPKIDNEDIYCSWIGGALGVGVGSGFSLLISEDDVLWTLFQGWKHYRTYLEQRPGLKGNQIDTWNGHWLAHSFNRHFEPNHPLDEFEIKLVETAGVLSIPTREWVQILFSLAYHYPDQNLMAYAYCLAKDNKTIGFVPLQLGSINRLCDLNSKLFLFPEAVQSAGTDALLRLYATHYGFARACQLGAIGLAAIEPAKLRDYVGGPDYAPKPLSIKTEEAAIQFAFQQIWILAMLNNQELYTAADRLAEALHQFTQRNDHRDSGRGKKNLDRQAEGVFVRNRAAFIDRLTDILAESGSQAGSYLDVFDEAVRQATLMPVDNFPLFIILTRFRYVARQSQGSLAIPTESSPA
ncbi:hypothetical protein E5K00_04280 [Hymenobacter aquaticus]|uniref:Type I-B CRISPR-associated protein Cas8b1/Cst1 n=1 Tax=Hymenobacter aquaticus TaxID=1867101 RepID=A0A4Z0Q4M5_9BACT|nr:hypothetical protein [Hymenobacter aquaticus]TGE24439.1 hypothetical protein E5K00_04280 [Hymenobacter aquaticus]